MALLMPSGGGIHAINRAMQGGHNEQKGRRRRR